MRRYAIEVVIFLTYALFAFSWVAGSTMAPTIMEDFHVEGMSAAIWSTNAVTIAKIIGNFIAAWFLVKLKPRKAFALASLLIVLGVLGVWADAYPLYILTRLIMGFGGAFVIVYFSPIVMNYYKKDEWPLVNGINSIAFNTGNLLALLFVSVMLKTLGSWQAVIMAISAGSFVLLIAWLFVSQDFPLDIKRADGQADCGYTLKEGLRDPFNWYLPGAYTGVLFAYISTFALLPLIPSFAVPSKHLASIMIGAGMVGTVVGIIAARRYPYRLPLLRWGGLMMSVFVGIMIFTAHPYVAYASAFLAGFFMFVPMTAMVTLPQELPDMTPGRVTVVFSMFWAISYAAETILMFIASALADFTGDPFIAAVFVLICSTTAFFFSFLLPETGQPKTPQSA